MDVAAELGKALDREITAGEQIDGSINAFIEKRYRQRVKEEGERQQEELWAESARKHNAAREAELRAEWSSYHREQAERHKAVLASLIEHHEGEAEKLGGDAA